MVLLPSKVQVVVEFPHLGSVNHFLPCNAHLLQPLYDALQQKKANNSVDWTSEQTSFNRAKSTLANAALLAHLAPTAPIALTTDAALEAVVEQFLANEWHPLAYFCHKLQDNERKYRLGVAVAVPCNSSFLFPERGLFASSATWYRPGKCRSPL